MRCSTWAAGCWCGLCTCCIRLAGAVSSARAAWCCSVLSAGAAAVFGFPAVSVHVPPPASVSFPSTLPGSEGFSSEDGGLFILILWLATGVSVERSSMGLRESLGSPPPARYLSAYKRDPKLAGDGGVLGGATWCHTDCGLPPGSNPPAASVHCPRSSVAQRKASRGCARPAPSAPLTARESEPWQATAWLPSSLPPSDSLDPWRFPP